MGLISILVIFFFSCVHGQTYERTIEEQIDSIFYRWDNNHTPGAAVAVVKDGAVVFQKGYGMANLEYGIPITESTVFHIASVSKQFTVFSVLLLEKQGKLSLDDDIRKYIPEVPDFGKTITLRHLASHTSGLRDQWSLLMLAGWRIDDVITQEHLMKIITNQNELNYDPGFDFSYSNSGFTLLAEVVSRVSGQSFSKFTEQNIFIPLGMSNSLFYDNHEKIVKNRAYSYYLDFNGYKKSVLNYANVGATSLFTTVEDLSLWAMNFSAFNIGDEEIFDTMNKPAVLNNGETFNFALGQFVGKYRGLNEIYHGGGDAGYRTFLTRFPDHNLSIIVLSNKAEFYPQKIAYKIADIFLKDDFNTEAAEVSREVIPIDQNILESYVGSYEVYQKYIINVNVINNQLSVKTPYTPSLSMIPTFKNEFTAIELDVKIKFHLNSKGNVKSLTLHQFDILEAKRMPLPRNYPDDLFQFTGTFYSAELSTSYDVVVENNRLIVRHNRLEDKELKFFREDTFKFDTDFFPIVFKFERDEDNKIIGFKITTSRVKNLWFQKVK